MVKSTRWMFLIALLVISSMLLSACGGENPTATTGTGGGAAAATDTPAAAAPAATDTPAAPAAAATDTPAAAGAATPTEAMAATPASGGAAGSTFDPSAYKKNAVEDGATLRVSSWGDTSEQQVNRDAIARFNQVYPNVKVNYEPQPTDYQTKLKAQVKGGSEPDVFYIDPGLAFELMPAGILMDLSPALQEVGRSKDDYFPSLINTFILDNKVYGLPKDFGSLAVFYNTDMLAKTGATEPKEGWSQDDFKNFVAKSVQGTDPNSKIYGTSVDPDPERWMAFALANGAKILDNNKCAINSDIGVSTLDWWYGMYKDKTATIPADVGAGWSGEAFAKQRIAATVQGGWLIPFMADPKGGFSNVKYDVAPLPMGKSGQPADLLFFNAWGASAKSKYPKAAAALALFLASRENEGAILQTGFALPTLKGFENDPFFQGTGVVNKASKLLYATAQYGVPDYYGGINDPKIKKSLTDATQRVYANQQSSKDALDQACQEIDPLLAGP
ncbi:MAG TPA: sugar ABC transporter substrate-binding protein [Chloroflexia bacterium]|nr:sugar ABC transporter substrate-binding protein [Chloroflexia bacterium]